MPAERYKQPVSIIPTSILEIFDSRRLVKIGIILFSLSLALIILGERIEDDLILPFLFHNIVKYVGVALFITSGVLLAVERLPETIHMKHLEEEMQDHGDSIAKSYDDSRAQVAQEGLNSQQRAFRNCRRRFFSKH